MAAKSAVMLLQEMREIHNRLLRLFHLKSVLNAADSGLASAGNSVGMHRAFGA